MENSEIRQQTILLGKAIVEELEQSPSIDILGRWMAHYIAELITKAEHATPENKEIYERECFDTIIKLWKHINKIPNFDTPLRTFDNIENMLDRITSEDPYRYFPPKYEDEINVYLLLAKNVDSLGKEIVKLAFEIAIAEASEEEKKWLQFDMLHEISNIQRVLELFQDNIQVTNDEIDISNVEKKRLSEKIKEFKKIIQIIDDDQLFDM